MKLDFEFVQISTSATVLGLKHQSFSGVCTDSRLPMQGQLFVALKGEAFDAHDFLASAITQGASGLLVHDTKNITPEILNQSSVFLVKDTLLALQSLAQQVRRSNKALVIGIAGSNGKTTSKEFTAALLKRFRPTHYSKGSFNNHWGVPFTLLAQPENAVFSVVEMGMNHTGELATLTRIAEPDVAVVTYVGVEHIEFFGTLEKIAEAEQEIYDEAPAGSLRIFNLDNFYTAQMYERANQKGQRVLTFSSTIKTADVLLKVASASFDSMVVEGQIAGFEGRCEVPVFGKHNITNLMVAASCALGVGLNPDQIWLGLSECRTTWGRNQWLEGRVGKLLFDAYNSNPDSVAALVENLNSIPCKGRRIGIFGEMRELGNQSAEWHRKTAALIGGGPFDEIWFFGSFAQDFAQGLKESPFSGKTEIFTEFDASKFETLAHNLKPQDIVVIKGSRGVKLERVAEIFGAKIPAKI
jgi:UDP-N-acetylmuramoyl-tripeptide--D-alanyl-D-alanine ligase